MKKFLIIVLSLSLLTACNEKKLTEVVEVPLPNAEEKKTIGNPNDVVADEGSFQVIKLPYKYESLAPHIDALTMEIHYSKHYLNYTNSLNKAIENSEYDKLTIEEILAKVETSDIAIRNNAGGYYNHNMYWKCMAPKTNQQPKDTLAKTIIRDFGSFGSFKTQFSEAGKNHFGSGWVWLIINKDKKLQITTTLNQDNPLMNGIVDKGIPILAMDVWEHAYYLNYQQKRRDYIEAFFKIINWTEVSDNYTNTF